MRAANVQPADHLLTAEEFWEQYGGRDFELSSGRVVSMPPTSGPHGKTDSRIGEHLGAHVRKNGLGDVFANTGFILHRAPDVIRGPDQAFVSNERASASPMPDERFWAVAPDLVVEIVSPNDSAEMLAEKLRDYLTSGVRMAWFVYPRQRRVHVFRPDRPLQILGGDDALGGDDVVPGFSMPLSELWG